MTVRPGPWGPPAPADGPDRAPAAAPAAEPVLAVRDLRVTFATDAGPLLAVRGVDLDVAPGRVHALVGESGSGKSAVAGAVMGLLPASARVTGSVRLGGDELLGLDDRAMSRRRGADLAMVFQDPLAALTPVMTVGEQVVEAVRVHDPLAPAAARGRAAELLDLVGVPDPRRCLDAYPHELSGGMRQRVVLAMAVAHRPRVILADEPTTALDVTVQAQVLDVLRTVRAETGAAIVLVTHDLGVVAGMADDVTCLYAGRVVERAPVDELYARPRMPYTRALLAAVPRVDRPSGGPLVGIEGTAPVLRAEPVGCPFAPRCPVVLTGCRLGEPHLVPVGRDHQVACARVQDLPFAALAPRRPAAPPAGPPVVGDVVLRATDVRRDFPVTRGTWWRRRTGTLTAVDGVSLQVRAGECLAVVGESGCGKSTLVHELAGLGRTGLPLDGTVEVLGHDVATLTDDRARDLRRAVQVVFQDLAGSLDPRLTVHDVVAEPLRAVGVPRAQVHERVAELVRRVGLPGDAVNRFPGHLSGGQRQRVGIARALATGPALLLLDEPVSALDASVQAGIVDLLAEVVAGGVAALVVAHDLALVRHLAHRVAVMHLGQVVEEGPTRAVLGRPAHPYTRALVSAAPVPDPAVERGRPRVVLRGDVPSPLDRPAGCTFAGRCPLRADLPPADRRVCDTVRPHLVPTVDGGEHRHACHHPDRAPGALGAPPGRPTR